METLTLENRKPIRKFKGREATVECVKSMDNTKEATIPYIVRVKRKRDQDALDQICKQRIIYWLHCVFVDLEFDKESGILKKTKFVSEAEVIQQQLASFGLSDTSSKPKKS